MDSVWAFVRTYHGFQQTEANLLKFLSLKLESIERYERFFIRLLAHTYDNLLKKEGLRHDGKLAKKMNLCRQQWKD